MIFDIRTCGTYDKAGIDVIAILVLGKLHSRMIILKNNKSKY